MTKKSIMNLVGSAERLAMMQQAVMAAAKRRREPGVATATASKYSYGVKGRTVVTPAKVAPIPAAVLTRS